VQRTRPPRAGCNRVRSWAGSLNWTFASATHVKLRATSDDDPGFVRLVSQILDSLVLQRAPDILAIIKVDNWFDHKWLNFSGKMLGALGVWKQPLTIPPFHPNRIKVQMVYRLSQQKKYELVEAPLLHILQPSSENLNRKLIHTAHATDTRVFVWWSGNTGTNAKGSFMAYIQSETDPTSWYVSFDCRDRWIINKTKNVSVEAVLGLLQSREPNAALNGGPAAPVGDAGAKEGRHR